LNLVLLNQRLGSLEFDYHAFIDPQISVVLPNNLAAIGHIDRLLLFDFQSQLFKFDSERVFIDLLKKAGTKRVVDCIRTTDDLLCEVIVFHETSNKTI
jgi:hypothetical protein